MNTKYLSYTCTGGIIKIKNNLRHYQCFRFYYLRLPKMDKSKCTSESIKFDQINSMLSSKTRNIVSRQAGVQLGSGCSVLDYLEHAIHPDEMKSEIGLRNWTYTWYSSKKATVIGIIYEDLSIWNRAS